MFPSNADPGFAPENRAQLAALAQIASIEVIGGVPWFWSRLLGRSRPSAKVRGERVDGLLVEHPRVADLPGLPWMSPALMAMTVAPSVWWRARARGVEVILAPYAYPDGVAAVALARMLGLPVVVKCRGPDLVFAENNRWAHRQMSAALRSAHRVVVVCEGLRDRAVASGARAETVRVVYDGVEKLKFRPRDSAAARRSNGLPLDRTLVLFAGPLEQGSGVDTFLEAGNYLLPERPDVVLVVAGEGSLENHLHLVAEDNGQILPVGHLPRSDMAEYLAAADVVCVPGTREGIPNVVREALATGRPVVASRAGGVAEVIRSPRLGRLFPPKDAQGLAQAVLQVLNDPKVEPADRIEEAGLPNWTESATALLDVLQDARREVESPLGVREG